jgi:hypothetical protein
MDREIKSEKKKIDKGMDRLLKKDKKMDAKCERTEKMAHAKKRKK